MSDPMSDPESGPESDPESGPVNDPPTRSRLRAGLAPRMWGAHTLMVVCVAAAVALGVWQYSNSQRAKEAQVDDLVHADPRALTELIGPDEAFPGLDLGRPSVIEGDWLPGGTVLVEEAGPDGRNGYWVATPVRVASTESALYVVRGWAPDEESVPAPPKGETRLVGWLQPPQQNGLRDEDPADDVLPEMDLTSVLDRVEGDIYSAYAVSAAGDAALVSQVEPANDGSTGLESVSAPQPPEPDSSTGLRNLLYAIEWWLFGVLALYIWWRYVRDVTRPASGEDDDEPTDREPSDQPVPSGS